MNIDTYYQSKGITTPLRVKSMFMYGMHGKKCNKGGKVWELSLNLMTTWKRL